MKCNVPINAIREKGQAQVLEVNKNSLHADDVGREIVHRDHKKTVFLYYIVTSFECKIAFLGRHLAKSAPRCLRHSRVLNFCLLSVLAPNLSL